MLSEIELKHLLRNIAADQYRLPGDVLLSSLAQQMIPYIGSPDPELRDNLVYACLAHWIMDGIFTPPEMLQLLDTCLDDEHISFRLGESNSDSVFTRSFSVLLLAPIIYRHRSQPFLDEMALRRVLDECLRCFQAEQDLRGYVEVKGWAHAVAHAADTLDELAQCTELGKPDMERILNALAGKACLQASVYTCGEDERTAIAATNALKRGLLSPEQVKTWLEGFGRAAQEPNPMPAAMYIYVNVTNFLRALYFRLRRWEADEELVLAVDRTLQKLSRY